MNPPSPRLRREVFATNWLASRCSKERRLERAKGFEPSTPTLARSCSTPELHPHPKSSGWVAAGAPRMPKHARECNNGRPGRNLAGPPALRVESVAAETGILDASCRTANSISENQPKFYRQPMPATPDDLFAFFDSLGIAHWTVTHAPLFTVEQSQALRGTIPGGHTKDLFLKDKKDAVFLVVAPEEGRVDLKTLHHKLGASRFSFGSAALLEELLGVSPGAVTAFGTINDKSGRVK